MREFLTSNSDADAIRLLTASSSRFVIALEGEDDRRLVNGLINSTILLYVGSTGKTGLLTAAQHAERTGVTHVTFVIDRDYDDFSKNGHTYPKNVVCSHNHDCFIDVILENFDILIRVIEVKLSRSHSTSSKDAMDTQGLARELLTTAIQMAKHKAAVRLLAARLSIGFNFNKFSFFSRPTADITSTSIYNSLATSYEGKTPLPTEASDLLFEATNTIERLDFSLIGDHDFIEAIRALLKESYGVSISEPSFRDNIFCALTRSHLSRAFWCQSLASRTRAFDIELFTTQ